MNGEEEWRPIRSHEGIYEVSDDREVRRISPGKRTYPGRTLKQWIDSHGRPRVTLYLRGKRTTYLVSRLVADAFLPAKSATDTVVRHLNDDPADNRPCNLARGTQKENMADAIRNDRYRNGAAHYLSKLTEDNIREIRRLYATRDFTQQELALRFGVRNQTISRIVRREIWKHVV